MGSSGAKLKQVSTISSSYPSLSSQQNHWNPAQSFKLMIALQVYLLSCCQVVAAINEIRIQQILDCEVRGHSLGKEAARVPFSPSASPEYKAATPLHMKSVHPVWHSYLKKTSGITLLQIEIRSVD
jgi:hypothetical protein